MPIREESFRIGCGRYIQGRGYIRRCGEEVLRLGNSPLIIGDETTLGITRGALEQSLEKTVKKYEFKTYNGTCNEEKAQEFANYAVNNGFDVFIGVGGGVITDFSKLCGYFSKLSVINIPTSSATCAAYTPLSIRYTPDGRTVGSLHFGYEVDAVICDTEIITTQPVRLFLAGVFDALAKFVEIKQRFDKDSDNYPIGLDYAFVMAERAYTVLLAKTQKCIDDIKSGKITDDVEKVIFICIAVAGVISGIARGSNQTALGHKFYETAKFLFPEQAKPFLHGEIVGIGLLLQNYFNGEEDQNREILNFMKKYNLPCKISDIGVDLSEKTFDNFYNKLCNSSAINEKDTDECNRLKEAMKYLWRIS